MKSMKHLLGVLSLLLALTVQAGEVRFNGVRPAVVIDVRTPQEFAAGHINGAINIPVDQIALGIRGIKWLKNDNSILVYCRSGRRSAHARAILEQQGFTRILDGGGMNSLARHLKSCTAKTC